MEAPLWPPLHIAIVFLASATLVYGGKYNSTIDIGMQAPVFTNLPATDGKSYSMSDFKEDVLVSPAVRDWDAAHDLHIELKFFHNWYSVAYLAMFFGLSLYWGHGRTPGKRLMKLRVISLHHDHLSLWTCIERALGYGASALELGFGFVQYFIHPNRQTVHDRIAETIVVCEDSTRSAK
jgi:hypothetical protein